MCEPLALSGGGVAFYDAKSERPEFREMEVWVSAILEGTPLTILPEQACVVSEVLEAIYQSAETGKVIEFRNEEIEKLQKRVAEELGFELVDHRLELYGKPKSGR